MIDSTLKPAPILNILSTHKEPPALNHLNQPSAWYERKINRLFKQLETAIMPQGRNNRPNNGNWTQMEFVQYTLRQEEIIQFRAWAEKLGDNVVTELAIFMAHGYKMSCRWDSENVCWIVTFTCIDEKSPNANMCLTSRSDDWMEAAALCLFKHDQIFPSAGWPHTSRTNTWG